MNPDSPRRLRQLRTALALCVAAGAVLACGGSTQPADSPDPGGSGEITVHVVNQSGSRFDVSTMYGRSSKARLGSVPSGGEATFTFFWRSDDLRMVVDFINRRTATSNPIEDLRRGDVLELTVPLSGAPELSRQQGG